MGTCSYRIPFQKGAQIGRSLDSSYRRSGLLLSYSQQSEQNGANGQEEYRSRRAQINKQDDFAEKNYKVLLHESKEDNLCLSLSQRLSFCRETEHAIKHDDRSLHVKET